jgi:hypothetical protein
MISETPQILRFVTFVDHMPMTQGGPKEELDWDAALKLAAAASDLENPSQDFTCT